MTTTTRTTAEEVRTVASALLDLCVKLDAEGPGGDAEWLANRGTDFAGQLAKFADDREFELNEPADEPCGLAGTGERCRCHDEQGVRRLPCPYASPPCIDCGEDLKPYVTRTRYREPSGGLCGHCAFATSEGEG